MATQTKYSLVLNTNDKPRLVELKLAAIHTKPLENEVHYVVEGTNPTLVLATPERIEVLERVLAFAEMGVKHDPHSPDMQIVRAMLAEMKSEATDVDE